MELSRRRFLKIIGGSAAAYGLSSLWVPRVAEALEKLAKGEIPGNLPVVWFQGQSCAGCSISTLNTVYPDIAEVLTQIISVEFHPNVMAASGDPAIEVLNRIVERKAKKFVLVVEGAIPTKAGGGFCTVGEKAGVPLTSEQWIRKLGPAAKAIINVGTCSAFGGIPAAENNPTGAQPVSKIVPKATMINVPGCPPHPDWVIGTISHVLLFGIPVLDDDSRPKVFYGKNVHENCERYAFFEAEKFASDYGEEGCYYELGCKGPNSFCDAPLRGWNNGVNTCIKCGSPCIGCVESTFPDHYGDGLYGKIAAGKFEREGIKEAKKALKTNAA
jgi:hydrogenase small subunit